MRIIFSLNHCLKRVSTSEVLLLVYIKSSICLIELDMLTDYVWEQHWSCNSWISKLKLIISQSWISSSSSNLIQRGLDLCLIPMRLLFINDSFMSFNFSISSGLICTVIPPLRGCESSSFPLRIYIQLFMTQRAHSERS